MSQSCGITDMKWLQINQNQINHISTFVSVYDETDPEKEDSTVTNNSLSANRG